MSGFTWFSTLRLACHPPALLAWNPNLAKCPIKLVLAASFSDQFALEFARLIRDFDARHAGTGCTIRIIADAALPPDLRLRSSASRLGFPVADPRRFGFDRDGD